MSDYMFPSNPDRLPDDWQDVLAESMHQHVAGQSLTHYPSDRPESETYSKDITYRFNDHGFRCDYNMAQLAEHSVNMFLGCSNTLGIGVNLEETWCHTVNASYQGRRTMFNMGQGGGSGETCYRLARAWIPRVLPKAVFMLTPPASRREFYTVEDEAVIYGTQRMNDRYSPLPQHMVSEIELEINRMRIHDAIEQLCTRHHIPFYYVNFHRELLQTPEWQGYFEDLARDGLHPGPHTHQRIAKIFTDLNPQ